MFYSSSIWGTVSTFPFVCIIICYTLQKYFLMHKIIECVEGIYMSHIFTILLPINLKKCKNMPANPQLFILSSTMNSHLHSSLTLFFLHSVCLN